MLFNLYKCLGIMLQLLQSNNRPSEDLLMRQQLLYVIILFLLSFESINTLLIIIKAY